MKLVSALLLILWTTAATAETVAVRSGDHETFTRLVFGITVGMPWTLGRTEGGYALALEGQDSFDISRAFDRIGRDRVSALQPADGRMDIAVNCDCHAQPLLFRPDMLVVDIVDGPAPAGSPFELSLEAPIPRETVVVAPIESQAISLGSNLMPDPLQDAMSTENRLTEMEAEILESFARAANQGMLDIAAPAIGDGVAVVSEEATQRAAAAAAQPVDGPIPRAPSNPGARPGQSDLSDTVPVEGVGVAMQTAIDRERTKAAQTEMSASGHSCISNDSLDITSWVTEAAFADQIAAGMAGLVTEDGALQSAGVVGLAKTYLSFGFGREALLVLGLDSTRSVERDILTAIAGVIDEVPGSTGLLSDQIGCAGTVALWSALASQSIAEHSEVERIAMLTSHRALPQALRGYLGGRLARLFLEAGEAETAAEILAVPSEDAPDPQSALTSVHVTEALEGSDAALDQLLVTPETGSRMTPEAVVELLRLTVAQGETVDDALIALADAMRFENRDMPVADDLAEAVVKAMIANDQFGKALTLLSDKDGQLLSDLQEVLLTETVLGMTTRSGDGEFIDLVFGNFPEDLSPEAENAVAARLMALGFAREADFLLAGTASGPAMAERRYLRAEAAFAQGQMDEGRDMLTGMTDQRAQDLLAKYLPDPRGMPSDATSDARVAWKSGAWQALESGEDALLQEAARAMLATPDDGLTPASLAAGRDLILEAEETRALAEELLARFSVDMPTSATVSP
jgi:hypothetical protein